MLDLLDKKKSAKNSKTKLNNTEANSDNSTDFSGFFDFIDSIGADGSSIPDPEVNAPKAENQESASVIDNIPKRIIKCSKCGYDLSAEARFCMKCGHPVEEKRICKACGRELEEQAIYCPICGTKAE